MENIKIFNKEEDIYFMEEQVIYEKRLKIVYRGEVWIAELPLNQSNIQGGRRPILVISNNACNKYSTVITAIPLTTKKNKRKDLPTHVDIISDTGVENTVLCEQLLTVSRMDIQKFLYRLDEEQMKQVEKCLQIQLGLIEIRRESMKMFLNTITNENSLNSTISLLKKMRSFFSVNTDEELENKIRNCSQDELVNFISKECNDKSDTTISNTISRVKKIFKYFENEEALKDLNLFKIKEKVSSKKSQYYLPSDIDSILKELINYQDKALVLLTYLGLYDNDFNTLSNLKATDYNRETGVLTYIQDDKTKVLELTELGCEIIEGAIKEDEMHKYIQQDGRNSKPYKIQINEYIFRSKERAGSLDKVSTATFKKRYKTLKAYLMDDSFVPVTIKNSKVIYDLVRYEYDYNLGEDINQLELKEYLKNRGQAGTIELLNMSKKELKSKMLQDILNNVDKKIMKI